MVRILTRADIRSVLDLRAMVETVAEGLIAQHDGRVERPERPHFPVGAGLGSDEPSGTALVMPAYVHGAAHHVTKLATVHPGNADHGLPTVRAVIVATSANDGAPAAYLDGTIVTNARTGCIGAVAARALLDGPLTLGVLGAGTQARWQTRAIGTVCDVSTVRVYAPSDSREACAHDLREDGFDATAVDTPNDAVAGADLVVTATTSRDPVFPADALAPEAAVIGVGAYTPEMQELEAAVLENATQVVADVPGEVAGIGDLLATDLTETDLVPLGALLAGEVKAATGGRVVVESVGSAVLDAVAVEALLAAAEAADVGVEIDV